MDLQFLSALDWLAEVCSAASVSIAAILSRDIVGPPRKPSLSSSTFTGPQSTLLVLSSRCACWVLTTKDRTSCSER